MDFEQALKNPGKVFAGVPEAVESSTEFDPGQKRAILLQWKDPAQGAQAIAQAARKAESFREAGDAEQEALWRRVENALREMRGPHQS